MDKNVNIAIDGPAGAGKSTIAKIVSKELGYIYVDTGAMYRAFAYYLLLKSISGDDITSIVEATKDADITIKFIDGEQRVFLNGEDVTGHLRDEATGNMASVSSAVPEVRAKLTVLQQKLAMENSVVMDGRDIGTTVLPNADVKVYLTASSKVRAKRRYDELISKGECADIDKIEADIIDRDYRDMHREASPLKKADDAIEIDSSYMTIDEVAKKIIDLTK